MFAAAAEGTLEARVANAFRTHPEYASGSRRDEAALMKAVPGLMCKAGAESVYAVGLPDGRGIAVKVEDGTPRARAVVMAATLQHLGLTNDGVDSQTRHPSTAAASRSAPSTRILPSSSNSLSRHPYCAHHGSQYG